MNATLYQPIDGYTAIELLYPVGLHWVARIIATGRLINVWSDEYEIEVEAEVMEA